MARYARSSLLLAALIGTEAPAVEGDFIRSLSVEKIGTNSYQVTCYVEYRDTNPRHTYLVNLWGGGSNISPTQPFGGEVSPKTRALYLSDTWWDFEATLGKRTLVVKRTFLLNAIPSPGVSTYCQGGARNMTTGQIFPSSLLDDQLND